MHTKLADVDDTRPPERFTLQSTGRAPPLTAPHDAVPHAEMTVRAWNGPPQLHNKYKRGFAVPPGIGCRRKTTPWSMPARFTWIAAESAATPTIVPILYILGSSHWKNARIPRCWALS